MKLPGLPRSPKGWYQYVERENWGSIEVVASGRGRKDGVRLEFYPTPEVEELIAKVESSGNRMSASYEPTEPVKPLVSSTGVHAGYVANQQMMMVKSHAKEDSSVNNWLLSNCFKACLTHYGDAFNALNVLDQMGYSTNLYNKLQLLVDVLNVHRNRLNDASQDVLVDYIKVLVALNVMPDHIIPTDPLYSF